jgi:hypothetical protein
MNGIATQSPTGEDRGEGANRLLPSELGFCLGLINSRTVRGYTSVANNRTVFVG